MAKNTVQLIGLVNKLEKVVSDNCGEISVTTAVLDDQDGKPRNFRFDWEFPKSLGGVNCRIVGYNSSERGLVGLVLTSGPEVSYCDDPRQYDAGAYALRTISKRLEAILEVRGPALDSADSLGRWLEACGVKQVYFRPERSRNATWHTDGDWENVPTGRFVTMVRDLLPPKA